MESLQQVKSRLGSVKNIGTITKAMEVVSATKMRKAQALALGSRPYAFAALAALSDILLYAPEVHLEQAALVARREVKNTLVVVLASDRGLAGAFNSSVTRALEKLGVQDASYVLVGRKLSSFALRKELNVVASLSGFGDYATHEDVAPLVKLITDGYASGKWDRVLVASTHFLSTLSQKVLTREILPMDVSVIRDTVREIIPESGKYSDIRSKLLGDKSKEELTSYIFEPDPKTLLNMLLPELLAMQVLHLLLEANASEHSARMVAMKSASENSKELGDKLLLEFNKARQAMITKEMIEISSSQIALK